jgi:non-specific serine/threonine protein kinase/serine/threonine-protein kinase
MDARRYRRQHELFDAARSLEPAARPGFLDEACGGDGALRSEVEALLERDGELGSRSWHAAPFASPEPVPPRVPGLHPVRLLGAGGYGEVWLAERQEPIEQRVAIKVIRPGLGSREVVARFEQERQALAVMSHPNIAKVFDAGSLEDGRPYFVMEYVDGEPITEFCDRRRLTLKQRLELLLPVCHAVQHAHTKGVIHRDLKPGNVLVEALPEGSSPSGALAGVPKVIDFGIAKSLEGALTGQTLVTIEGQLIGTPGYMSPEQAGGEVADVDTRTDVYSLGVLLYELLTGLLPFDPRGRTFAELRNVLGSEEPLRPSRRLAEAAGFLEEAAATRRLRSDELIPLLRQELDWIPVRALRRAREERYRSPAELGDDLARYLSDRPLWAGPESAGYRVRKFVSRHRASVFGAAATLLALVAGLVCSIAFAVGESEARRDAVRIADFQGQLLRGLDPLVLGKRLAQDLREAVRKKDERGKLDPAEVAARGQDFEELLLGADLTGVAVRVLDRNILERAIVAIERDFGDQPLLQARLQDRMAGLCLELGLGDRAVSAARAAFETRERLLGGDHPATIEALRGLGMARFQAGNPAEAEPPLRRVLEWWRGRSAAPAPELHRAELSLGILLGATGRATDAEPIIRQALAGFERLPDVDELVADARYTLAVSLDKQSRWEEAEGQYREAVAVMSRAVGEDHERVLRFKVRLAMNLAGQRRYEEAEPVCRSAVEGLRKSLGGDHPDTMSGLAQLGTILSWLGRPEAEEVIREAVEALRRTQGSDAPRSVVALFQLARTLAGRGRHEEAEPLYREARLHSERLFTPQGVEHLKIVVHHGITLTRLGRFAEAEPMLLAAERELSASPVRRPELTHLAISALARLYRAWHRAEPASGHDERARSWRSRLSAGSSEEASR